MDAKYMRDKVVDYTIQRLKIGGIRKIKMDDISNSMGMSKRTLYQLFENKETLIGVCLDIFFKNGRKLLYLNESYTKEDSMNRVLHVLNCYITSIHLLKRNLLSELASYIPYSTKLRQEELFWKNQFMQALENCREQFSPIVEEKWEYLANDILYVFYQNCINGQSYQSQLQMGYVFVKGLVSRNRLADFDLKVQLEWKRLVAIWENFWQNMGTESTSA